METTRAGNNTGCTGPAGVCHWLHPDHPALILALFICALLPPQIEEILESGELQKAKYLTETEEARTINLFANIWGERAHHSCACQSTDVMRPSCAHSPLFRCFSLQAPGPRRRRRGGRWDCAPWPTCAIVAVRRRSSSSASSTTTYARRASWMPRPCLCVPVAHRRITAPFARWACTGIPSAHAAVRGRADRDDRAA